MATLAPPAPAARRRSGGASGSGSSSATAGGATPAPAASRHNPIALRIYKAIGTSFDDAGSREALEIASSFYSAEPAGSVSGGRRESSGGFLGVPSQGGTRSRAGSRSELGGRSRAGSLSADGDARTGSTASTAPPTDPDGMPLRRTLRGQSAAAARRNLKRDVEARMAGGAQRFLEAFGEVDQKLDVLRDHMLDMQSRCDAVQGELDQANSGTKYLLERADGLRSQRASAQLRLSLLKLFLARFTLSPAEETALTERDLEVGPELFTALDRVEAIRHDCQALLGGDEDKMQAGLDIMKATGTQMETGYAKLHRWVEFQFRQMTREGGLEVSGVLREAVARLGKRRPAMLKDALDVLTSTRQGAVLTAFLDALTRGGPNGLPRPIEIHAHDPTRYVGDMLAWVHQATASEHELLESLFGARDGSRRMVGAQRPVADTDDQRRIADALDRDLEGLSRPLKLRIEQTVKSQEGIIMTYRIVNLVQFYLVTMRKTVGPDAQLVATLQEIYDHANGAFFETLQAQGRSLLRFLHPPDATLSPPLSLRDVCQVLREIIAVYDTSLVDDAERETDFARILDAAVDPAVEMCERMADLRKQSGTNGAWDRDVFLVNCLEYLQHTLEAYPFTAPRVKALQAQIDAHVESMTFEHHGKLLEQCGLAPVMRAMHSRPEDTPLSRQPGATSKELTAALTQFSSFLTSHDPLTSPRLALLADARLAETIHRTALRRIAEAYAEIADHVLDKKEGYEFAETLLRRGRDEVEVALGVAQ